MNLKPYKLTPETTSPLLRSQSGFVPRGSDFRIPLLFICLSVYVCLCVCVYMSKTEMYSCPVVQFHTNSSQLFKIITGCHRKHRHPGTHTHTKSHIWTGLAHSSFYTNVGDKSTVIECASVQLFSP